MAMFESIMLRNGTESVRQIVNIFTQDGINQLLTYTKITHTAQS